MAVTTSKDSVRRAMTNDGAFRVITARTTDTVDEAVGRQTCRGDTARMFGDLLTGAILFREAMAPDLRVQGILRGAQGKGSLVADAMPDGSTRGLVQLPSGAEHLELGTDALLQMMRSLPGGRINQGIVKIPDGGGISDGLMAYMQVSEQVDTMIAVGTLLDDAGKVRSAGGYLVQLLPEVGRGPLMIMTERLEDFRNIDDELASDDFSPAGLMNELLHGMEFTNLDDSRVRFACWCSEVRLVSALSTLSRADLEELTRDGEVLEIRCEYCQKEYRILPARLQGLLQES